VTVFINERGERFYQFSEKDALAIAKHREALAGEVLKGIVGMRAYRRLLEKHLSR